MAILDNPIFTYTLTGSGTFSTNTNDGIRKISVYNPSAVTGTVLGTTTTKVNGITPTAVNVQQNETWTCEATDSTVLGALTITAPTSCTLIITAIQ